MVGWSSVLHPFPELKLAELCGVNGEGMKLGWWGFPFNTVDNIVFEDSLASITGRTL
jgi:hypothetical protein